MIVMGVEERRSNPANRVKTLPHIVRKQNILTAILRTCDEGSILSRAKIGSVPRSLLTQREERLRSYDHVGKRRRRRRTKSEAAALLTRLPAFPPVSHHSLVEGGGVVCSRKQAMKILTPSHRSHHVRPPYMTSAKIIDSADPPPSCTHL